MKKLLSLAIIVVLVSSIFLVAVPINAAGPTIADVEPVDWRSGLAGQVPIFTMTPEEIAEAQRSNSLMQAQSTPPIGTVVWDYYLRQLGRAIYGPTANYPYMTLRAISGNVEIWVAGNPANNDYRLLKFLDGDPRNDNPLDWNVTEAMCQYIADEFNNVIYPTDTQYFGAPNNRDGTNTIFEQAGWPAERWNWIATDNPQRVIIKIFNILDNAFYHPEYPSYVVGFYDPTYTIDYYNRNMIHVDNWNYSQRLGPMGYSWYPGRTVTRPYVYESTIAHEFQHNIHQDWNPADDSFMNEGCSMYAELLCNYGIDPNYINYYLTTPDNSLTVWEDQGNINVLTDYGESALWTIYLSDNYGGAAFIKTFVQSGIPGIAGVNAALKKYHYKVTFNDVYHDWRIANAIHYGKYNYKTIDLTAPGIIPIRTYEKSGLSDTWTTGTSFGETITYKGYSTGVYEVGPYGSDYIKLDGWAQQGTVYFDGRDYSIYGWTQSGGVWYSDGENLINTLIYGQAYVDQTDPYLRITTKYAIEEGWDFGFVQVSTDGGRRWTSLANSYTTSEHDPSAYPGIISNLPGLTGASDWITMEFDLSAYIGQTVLVGFRYMTDWFVVEEGWYIQDPTVSGAALTLTSVYPEADYMVTAIQVYTEGGITKYYVNGVNDLDLDDMTETGNKKMFVTQPDYTILVVSPISLKGWNDYSFKAN